jgi:hypothetical protein
MNFLRQAIRSLFVVAVGVSISSIAQADPLEVKITNAITASSYTVGNSSSPTQIVAATFLDAGNPFPVGFTYVATGNSNVPGNTTVGNLTTNSLALSNVSGASQTIVLEFDAGLFTLPAGPGWSIDTRLSVNDLASGVTGVLETYINGILLDSQTIQGLGVGGSSIKTTSLPSTGSYSLKSIFTAIVPVTANVTNLSITSSVHAVPEAWNVVSVVATMIPVGLFYLGRRKQSV